MIPFCRSRLHLARELDVLAGSPTIQKETVLAIRERLLNATKDLREYCENLSPHYWIPLVYKWH